MTGDGQGFQAPQTITPEGLADDLAVLVWESFTDFVSEWEGASTLAELGLVDDDGQPDRTTEETASDADRPGPEQDASHARA